MVCAGTACVSNNSFEIKEALEEEIKKQGLEKEVLVVTTGCNGFCERGPLLVVQPGNIFYQQLTLKDIPHLVEEHFLKGRPVEKLMYTPPKEKSPFPVLSDIDFFKKQVLIALRNRGLIDPEKIDEYIARDGYQGHGQGADRDETRGDHCRSEKFRPAGTRRRRISHRNKMGICAKGSQPQRREQVSSSATVTKGIREPSWTAASSKPIPMPSSRAWSSGPKPSAQQEGFVYVRNEYPLAVQRLNMALDDSPGIRSSGQGHSRAPDSISTSRWSGEPAPLSAEKKPLFLPRSKDAWVNLGPGRPIPAEEGLWGYPTVINNVETWANVPPIINRGAKWYSSIGTETSKGTKVFSLVGKINNTGLVEVPMGITLREIIYDIGGGIPDGKDFKAVQTGGPSGGCIPKEQIDLPIDYESLTEAGSMMGSGGMVVMDEETCMVDVARYFLAFTQDESCGKCTPCREGTKAMLDILTRITKGEGTEEDLDPSRRAGPFHQEYGSLRIGQHSAQPRPDHHAIFPR